MIEEFIRNMKAGAYEKGIKFLYPLSYKDQPQRFIKLAEGFEKTFGKPSGELRLFSSPGRTEIGGNHTDHQRGRVLAAAVEMDAAAVGVKTDNGKISVQSRGYSYIEIDINDLAKRAAEENTTMAIIRGVTSRLAQLGYNIGGFSAYIDSNVPSGSGLSSSASFENLIVTMLNCFYNNAEIDSVEMAKISQYTENEYFGKPSGLLDQAASAVGGVVAIDFEDKENPQFEAISLDLADYNHLLCVVNTGGTHGDLTHDYTDIFSENREIAEYFGKAVLRQVEEADFLGEIPKLRDKFGDRSVLRALHFFGENQRVLDQIKALKAGDFKLFKKLIIASGQSSFNRLQNAYSPTSLKEQPITLALEMSKMILEPVGGAWRVHGGGFAGTILAIVPEEALGEYRHQMDYIFGKDATQVLSVRPMGSCEIVRD